MANTSPKYNEKYRIFDVFTEKQLVEIKDYCRGLNLQDGVASQILSNYAQDPEKYALHRMAKKNQEAYDMETVLYNKIKNSIFNQDAAWQFWTTAHDITRPMYSQMDVGGYYKPHFDHPQGTGMFSTTIFLDDPDTYEGGELEIYADGKVESFKLDAGQAVTYETGLAHQVKEVTSGQRRVLVFWAKTQSTNFETTYKIREYVIEQLKYASPSSPHGYYPLCVEDYTTDLEEFANKPHVKNTIELNKILRQEYINNKLST